MKTPRTAAYIALALVIAFACVGEGIYFWKEHVHHPEAGALSGLEALYTMQLNYQHDHGRYAESFQELGAPLGAVVTGQTLDWKGGYLYTLYPIRRDWSDEITRYIITARPQKYGLWSEKSFSVDNLGTLRYTNENRAPNERDPVEAVDPLK
jgi:hypothetical protein